MIVAGQIVDRAAFAAAKGVAGKAVVTRYGKTVRAEREFSNVKITADMVGLTFGDLFAATRAGGVRVGATGHGYQVKGADVQKSDYFSTRSPRVPAASKTEQES